jgi:hypothetical protein
MYYRGPGFLAVIRFGFFPFPSAPLSRKKARPATYREKRDKLLTGESGGEREGAKSYDGEESLVLYSTLNTVRVEV